MKIERRTDKDSRHAHIRQGLADVMVVHVFKPSRVNISVQGQGGDISSAMDLLDVIAKAIDIGREWQSQ
jgi:hypothetical protein